MVTIVIFLLDIILSLFMLEGVSRRFYLSNLQGIGVLSIIWALGIYLVSFINFSSGTIFFYFSLKHKPSRYFYFQFWFQIIMATMILILGLLSLFQILWESNVVTVFVRSVGIEPTTVSLKGSCSTSWAMSGYRLANREIITDYSGKSNAHKPGPKTSNAKAMVVSKIISLSDQIFACLIRRLAKR